MPKLPTHESQVTVKKPSLRSPGVTPVTASPRVVPLRGMEQSMAPVQNVLEGAGEVVQKWQTAEDTMDYTAHAANKATFLATQKAAALNDPDPDNQGTYQANISEWQKTSLEGFRNKELAAKVAFEDAKDAAIANMEIGAIFKKKQMHQNEIDIARSIEAFAEEKRNAPNAQLAQAAQKKIDNLLMLNLTTGMITPAKAAALKNLQVKNDILSDNSIREKDSVVLADLRAGKQGPYGYLLESERLEAIKDMQARIFQNNQAYKRELDNLQTDTAINTAQSLVDGKLTSLDIETGLKLGVMDADTARVFTEAIGKRDVFPEKKIVADAYMKVFEKNLDDKIKAKEIIKNATKEWQSGNIKDDEYGYFIQLAQRKLERERGGQSGWDKVTQAFINGLNKLKAFTGEIFYPNMVQQLIESTKQPNNEPEAVADEIVRQKRREKYPWINQLPPEGEIRLFPDGVKRRIFPDGRIEDAK